MKLNTAFDRRAFVFGSASLAVLHYGQAVAKTVSGTECKWAKGKRIRGIPIEPACQALWSIGKAFLPLTKPAVSALRRFVVSQCSQRSAACARFTNNMVKKYGADQLRTLETLGVLTLVGGQYVFNYKFELLPENLALELVDAPILAFEEPFIEGSVALFNASGENKPMRRSAIELVAILPNPSGGEPIEFIESSKRIFVRIGPNSNDPVPFEFTLDQSLLQTPKRLRIRYGDEIFESPLFQVLDQDNLKNFKLIASKIE